MTKYKSFSLNIANVEVSNYIFPDQKQEMSDLVRVDKTSGHIQCNEMMKLSI